ncbi:glycoprotein hormone beta subunit [Aplysia californica]|nr:glycoprotein hormone beta subunit [Aplysia californica]AAX35673.1 glycoprotein hormone beta subunit [Aplysia californica]
MSCLLARPSSCHLVDPRTTLSCHVRSYQFRVTKPPVISEDGQILRCSGIVTVNSCWGRCDSSEIGDYLMPYRISHHPVCTYTGRVPRQVTLSGCEDYPDPTFEVFDAAGCECRLCDSDYTSCENLNG